MDDLNDLIKDHFQYVAEKAIEELDKKTVRTKIEKVRKGLNCCLNSGIAPDCIICPYYRTGAKIDSCVYILWYEYCILAEYFPQFVKINDIIKKCLLADDCKGCSFRSIGKPHCKERVFAEFETLLSEDEK